MSYILEALRKSQQERELGHVPTLETSSFLSAEGGARPNLWVLAAVILAGLAVIIALYSALRGSAQIREPVETMAEEPRSEAPVDDSSVSSPAAPPVAVEPDSDGALPPPGVTAPAVPKVTDIAEPRRSVAMETPTPSVSPPPSVEAPPRQPETLPPAPPARTQSAKVPQDLVADIEAFKREIREEQSTKTGANGKTEKIAPRDLRLPKDARARLPEFVMSAHIYDKEPSKRFVLINGLKTREGEESREEITVEEILPDGAVLRFDGNRFFQRR